MKKRTFTSSSCSSEDTNLRPITIKFLSGDLFAIDIDRNAYFWTVHQLIAKQFAIHPRLLHLTSESEDVPNLGWVDNMDQRLETDKRWQTYLATHDEIQLVAVVKPLPQVSLAGVDQRGWDTYDEPAPNLSASGKVGFNFPTKHWHSYSSHGFNLPDELVEEMCVKGIDMVTGHEYHVDKVLNVAIFCSDRVDDYVLRVSETGIVRLVNHLTATFPNMASLDMRRLCVEYTPRVRDTLCSLPLLLQTIHLPRPLIRFGVHGQVEWTDDNVQCVNNYDSCVTQLVETRPDLSFGVHILFDEECLFPEHVNCRGLRGWQEKFAGHPENKIVYYSLWRLTLSKWA